MDCKNIAVQVYDLAGSHDPLAPLVKEALDVIDQALDTHRWVRALHARQSLDVHKKAGGRVHQLQRGQGL